MNNTINRLIIIGNGFDLAHGMKTKYKDFVNGYLRQRIESFDGENSEDLLIKIKYNGNIMQPHRLLSDYRKYLKLKELNIGSRVESLQSEEKMLLNILYGKLHPNEWNEEKNEFTEEEVQEILNDCAEEKENEIHLTQGIIQLIEEQGEYSVEYSPFFKKVYDEIEHKNWVDIEYTYYEYLCSLLKKLDLSDEEDVKKEVSKEIDELNEEMKFITKKLKEYLEKEDAKAKAEAEKNPAADKEMILEIIKPFRHQEIAVSAEKYWEEFIAQRKMGPTSFSFDGLEFDTLTDKSKVYDKYISDEDTVQSYDGTVHKLFPGKVFLLNFNYTTNSESSIISWLTGACHVKQLAHHIHGDLNDENSIIIFGYGDDSDEMYKKLLDKNDNRFLENDKTTKYMGSAKYRNFLGFIESAPFQVCIMGHSCGISDKTLLSTIFQHENCVSIKPYFYENGDNDDYYEIIKNISRCFDDKKLMRDRVVNKEYCEPLPQPAEDNE